MRHESAVALVTMTDIVKRFDRVVALAGVDLTVRPGTVHAVVGENGAGKSTLMHILAGVLPADAGQIAIRGKPAQIDDVETANRLGIAMVHQHFMLFPTLSVAENLTIGREPRRLSLYDRQGAEEAVRDLGQRYGLHVDPLARVADLSVGDLQRLEILRALYRGAEILILDEPTGVLTPQEAVGLFKVIRELKRDGKTTIFISHKLEEVLEISEDITVLRDGRVTGQLKTAETTAREIARMMVGRDVFLQFDRPEVEVRAPVLELQGVTGAGIKNVSLTVHGGEIVGIAGVAGNGQSELADLIAGLQPVTDGAIRLNAHDVTRASVAERRAIGLANIPEDRYKRGLAAGGALSDNLILGMQERPPLSQGGLLNLPAIAEWALRLIQQFQIKAEGPEAPVSALSGGNAQKVVVARELGEPKPCILAAQPTRGIDVAATEFVRNELLRRRSEGAGVLLISADLGEILSLSDTILVMFGGRIIGSVPCREATETQLGLWMAGVEGDHHDN